MNSNLLVIETAIIIKNVFLLISFNMILQLYYLNIK
jgi:hypothetical protein